jgi:hypothetical protein
MLRPKNVTDSGVLYIYRGETGINMRVESTMFGKRIKDYRRLPPESADSLPGKK